MHIDEDHFLIKPAWEGNMVPPAGVYAMRGQNLPRVSIGKPTWWDSKVLGESWVPPAGGNRYGLARFAFSLSPQGRQEVRKAELMVSLESGNCGPRPVAFDLAPRAEIEEQSRKVTLGIGPNFKFYGLDMSVGKAETTIDLNRSFQVITTYGIGESTARWVFDSRPARPLVGSQLVYVVVEIAPGVEAAQAHLYLTVEIATKIGPIRGLLPHGETNQMVLLLK
jgi:hypothetical protein